MPVVWSPRHRGHAPGGGYWLGVREAGDEEPERGDILHDRLADAGAVRLERGRIEVTDLESLRRHGGLLA